MKITLIEPDDLLQVDSTILANLLSSPTSYTDVNLIASLNCITTQTLALTIADGAIYDTSKPFYFYNGLIYIKPSMYNLSTYSTDGIYGVNLRLKPPTGGSLSETSCAFIDITFKCKLSNYLEGLISGEDTSSIVHLLHYALFNGSNCGCNCDELCTIFNTLSDILKDSTTQTNDCGC